MLNLTIEPTEMFDESTGTFVTIPNKIALRLEHSLLSISKWESKWHKPFLKDDDKSVEEVLDYIRCMTVTQGVPDKAYYALTKSDMDRIQKYIQDPMTATWFSEDSKDSPKRSIVTSEIIYYQMLSLGIPLECEKWHLNRLLTLIRVFGEKNKPPKKMSKSDAMRKQRALNEYRRKKYQSSG